MRAMSEHSLELVLTSARWLATCGQQKTQNSQSDLSVHPVGLFLPSTMKQGTMPQTQRSARRPSQRLGTKGDRAYKRTSVATKAEP
jgi:hypothetical protein